MEMGTRSLTYVYDENFGEEPILCMYRQFDGYPENHGKELAIFLNSKKLVNGLLDNKSYYANGMGCLSASMVGYFKKEAGGIYIYPPKLNQDYWQDFEYHVKKDNVVILFKKHDGYRQLFSGNWNDFLYFCLKHDNGAEE